MLTQLQITAAKPNTKPYSLSDGQGLSLTIQPTGAKLWRFRYRYGGVAKTLHMGPWPTTSLAEAREKCREARKAIADGLDPVVEKKRAKIAEEFATATTFKAVALEWIAKCEREGRAEGTLDKIRWLLGMAYPLIGSHPIDAITPIEALSVLRKVEDGGRYESARRMRSVLSRVFRYGIATARCDRDVAADLRGAVACANDGRYSVDLHLRHDPNASEAFAVSHVRRLEAMRRAGAGPERQADGTWVIPDDHLARAEAYAQRQQRDRPVTLAVLSSTPVAELATKDAPSWLDRELAEGASSAVRDAGFGREVRTALAARRQWLIEQELATGEGQDFRMGEAALESLRQRELAVVGDRLSEGLGKSFKPARTGERIEGVIARRVDLESGPYALVERSRDFGLVPWRDVLERNIGKAASGVLRADGISWTFGRGRTAPTIG